MVEKKLYKYESEDKKGIIITSIKLNSNDRPFYRLVADNKKILTDGIKRKVVVDCSLEDKKNWVEVDKTSEELQYDEQMKQNEEIESVNYKELLDIVTGNKSQ